MTEPTKTDDPWGGRLAAGLIGGTAAVGLATGALALFTGWMAQRVEAEAPPQGRFLELDGHRIHYVDEGSGPPMVLVHGLGGQIGDFTYALVDRLKHRFRVVALERPGSGYSERAANASASPSGQAAILARFIAALGLERPLVVGHSLGGAIALALALDHPEATSGLALLSPLTQPQHGAPGPFLGLYMPVPALRWLIAWTAATPAALLGRDAAYGVLFGPEEAPADFAIRGGGLLGLRPDAYYAASTDMMAIGGDMPRLAARYGELKLPVAILFGQDDHILEADLHGRRTAAAIAGATYEAIPRAGHMIPVTRPDEVSAFIERTMRRATAEGGENPR